MAPSKLSKKPAMKTIAKVAKNSMKATKIAKVARQSMKATKKPAATVDSTEGQTQYQPKLKVWDMVLHCTKPNCGRWEVASAGHCCF